MLFTIALGGLGYLLVTRGVVLAKAAQEGFAPGGQARESAERLAHYVGISRIDPETITTRLGEAAGEVAKPAAEIAGTLASLSANLLLGLFFAVMAMHFFLRHWRATATRLEAILPLDPRHTRALLQEFRHVGRAVLLGTVLTGLAQGALAGVGYWITGLPQPAFFGALTAVASLIPAVGTLLIWVPAGAYLMLTEHFTAGVIELAWGALVVVESGLRDPAAPGRRSGGHSGRAHLRGALRRRGVDGAIGLDHRAGGDASLALAALRIYETEVAAPAQESAGVTERSPGLDRTIVQYRAVARCTTLLWGDWTMFCRVSTREAFDGRGASAAATTPTAPGDAGKIEARTGFTARGPWVGTSMPQPVADQVGDQQEGFHMRAGKRVGTVTILIASGSGRHAERLRATSEEWAEWKAHSTHFASDQHMGFSVRNNKDGSNLRVTRSDMAAAPRENWWGKALTVSPNQIFQD